MKIVISEKQLRRIISEQPESRFPMYGMTDKERINAVNSVGRPKLSSHLGADDYVDIVSGLLDVIPGIGNIASAGIDLTHGITYIVRFFNSKTVEEKAEMAVMGLITLGMTFIPIGGNVANITARTEIKTIMRQTPYEVKLTLQKMGLIKNVGFNLSKQVWKYSVLIALAKIFRGQLDNVIGDVTKKLTYVANKSEDLRPILQNYITTINEISTIKQV